MDVKTKHCHYRNIIQDSGDPGYVNRVMVGTAVTGLVRIEWVSARYGQTIPVNWSMIQANQFLSSYFPLRYQVADAQNLIVKAALELDFNWLIFAEHDVIPPLDMFIRMNHYMRTEKVPVVSGLYYTRSWPSEPLVFRGRGTGAYYNWKLGDKVWCDGVPTGMLLIHCKILRSMWNESETYMAGNVETRRVFETPRKQWLDPEGLQFNSQQGTSDLDWCTRVMEDGHFAKAGWPKFQEKEYPFLVDTRILCSHINQDGSQFPGDAYIAAKRQADQEKNEE